MARSKQTAKRLQDASRQESAEQRRAAKRARREEAKALAAATLPGGAAPPPPSAPAAPGAKRRHRFRPGTVALRNIRKYQGGAQSKIRFLSRAAMDALCYEMLDDVKGLNSKVGRFTRNAKDALREVSEMYLTKLFKRAMVVPASQNRTSLSLNDYQLAVHFENPDVNALPDKAGVFSTK